jgi:large subunit ribosomal protein L18
MNRLDRKSQNMARRKRRVRAVVSGTAKRPRLSVFISHKHVTAQLIDDDSHKTIAHATTVGNKLTPKNMSERAVWVGQQIGKKAKAVKITQVTLDRGGRIYHGRVKALADAARNEGLEF